MRVALVYMSVLLAGWFHHRRLFQSWENHGLLTEYLYQRPLEGALVLKSLLSLFLQLLENFSDSERNAILMAFSESLHYGFGIRVLHIQL